MKSASVTSVLARAASEGLLVDIAPPIAKITVNRPRVRNAMSYELSQHLVAVLDVVNERAEVRIVVLSGAGERAFISGADMTEFSERLIDVAGAHAYDEALERLARRLETLRQPVIAAINGAAVGTGLLIALACDIRIAVAGTKFCIPVSKVGLIPSLPDVHRLVTFTGRAFATHLLLSGAVIEAEEACARGLVDSVVALEGLAEAVTAYANILAERAPLSMAGSKAMIDRIACRPTIEDGADLYASIYESEDFREGVAAFLAKRPPMFSGK